MRFLAIAAATLAAAAVPASAQNPAAVLIASPSVQEFVKRAVTINMYEIDAARLAEDKATDPTYKSYANMIITDDTKMSNDLKSKLAGIQGIEIPNELGAPDEQKLRHLKSELGASFERAYRAGQIEGQETAIKLFETFAQSGSDPDLKALVQSGIPILQKHLLRAETLPDPNGPAVGIAETHQPSAASTAPGMDRAR